MRIFEFFIACLLLCVGLAIALPIITYPEIQTAQVKYLEVKDLVLKVASEILSSPDVTKYIYNDVICLEDTEKARNNLYKILNPLIPIEYSFKAKLELMSEVTPLCRVCCPSNVSITVSRGRISTFSEATSIVLVFSDNSRAILQLVIGK